MWRIFQIFLIAVGTVYAEEVYNWLTLALLSTTDYLPHTIQPYYPRTYDMLCNRLVGLNPAQKEICKNQPMSIPFVSRGVREALYHCQVQFKYERWNCSDRHEVTNTTHGLFKDILGKTLRSTTKEASFLQAIASAGIVFEITKGCNSGNLSDCGCDSNPKIQKFIDPENSRTDNYTWGGCSDNVAYGARFARRFLDEWESRKFDETKEIKHLVNKHNHFVGREAIAQNIRRQCRCHGVSGSCEFKTCWLTMPKFSEVAELLKKRYEKFAVQVARRAKKRLRRKERSERMIPIRGNELTFIYRSPSYCERNDTLGIPGTLGRECRHSSYNSDSCDLLCCGRGYNTKMERRRTQCQCKFVWCCQVKCKECIEDINVHTCK